MKTEIKAGNLVITIPMGTPSPSATGKTLIVAKSAGPTSTEAKVGGKSVTVNFQAWISAR